MITPADETFMRRALALAVKGRGRVSPNPMVGCVIVHGGKIIAEGFHKRFGGPHAEIEAMRQIYGQARGTTLYVTLEPCHHHGKTPPCVDAILISGVARVVIAMPDPNPLTSKKSIRKLKAAGVIVDVGVCANEARELNRFFTKHVTTGLPYVTAKVAQSLDGCISTKCGKQGWLTGAKARAYVQDLRQGVDAILIGSETARIDDPLLNVRAKKSPQPKRVVLDSQLKISLRSRLFFSHGGEVIVFCAKSAPAARRARLENLGARVIPVREKNAGLLLGDVLKSLGELGVMSVLVEGGAKVFTTFLKENLADEWRFIIAPRIVGVKGTPAFDGKNLAEFQILSQSNLGEDFLVCARQVSSHA